MFSKSYNFKSSENWLSCSCGGQPGRVEDHLGIIRYVNLVINIYPAKEAHPGVEEAHLKVTESHYGTVELTLES
jgi:hypothetical protein